MKKSLFYMASLLVFMVMIAFYACNQSPTPAENSQIDAFTPVNSSFVDFESYSEPVNVASFERDLLVIVPRYGDLPIPRRFPLHSIFRALKLDSAQIAEVRIYLTNFKDCTAPVLAEMRQDISNLTDSNRLVRKSIIDSLRNNVISRTQAQTELDSLNSQSGQKLVIIILKYCPSLQDCLKTLLDNTTSLINQTGTDVQKQAWQTFLSSLPTDPCNPSNIKIRFHHGRGDDDEYDEHHYQDSLHHYMDSLWHHEIDSLEHHLDSLRHHGHEGRHHR